MPDTWEAFRGERALEDALQMPLDVDLRARDTAHVRDGIGGGEYMIDNPLTLLSLIALTTDAELNFVGRASLPS